jgi:uncharacterized protein YkwD
MRANPVHPAAALFVTVLSLAPGTGWSRPEEAGRPAETAAGCAMDASGGPSCAPEPGTDLDAWARQMAELVNRDRADPANARETRGQAQPLKWNERLAAAARAHCRDMIARGYFGHTDPDGVTPAMRVTAAGVIWQAQGENIAEHYGIEQAERAFMDEPAFQHNHRGNILNPRFTEVGIGVIRGPNGLYYITQEFVGTSDGAPGRLAAKAQPRSPGVALR